MRLHGRLSLYLLASALGDACRAVPPPHCRQWQIYGLQHFSAQLEVTIPWAEVEAIAMRSPVPMHVHHARHLTQYMHGS